MTRSKPNLKLVQSKRTANAPVRNLGKAGLTLWISVVAQYDIDDVSGKEILQNACEATDRIQEIRNQIDRDGVLLPGSRGRLVEHPLLRSELQNRAFVSKCFARLNLDMEPLRAGSGRPPKNPGWQPPDEEE